MNILQDLFITVLNMSFTASLVALSVILVRLLLRKTPKVFSYLLWAVVFFRFLCPFSFSSDFSILTLVNITQTTDTVKYAPYDFSIISEPMIQSDNNSIDNTVSTSLTHKIPVTRNTIPIWTGVLSFIWVAGVMALLIYCVFSYVKIKKKLKTATLVEGNVFETDVITTPFVFGFIHPKIYLPVDVKNLDLSYILEHERTHIRRRDYLIKPLAFLALILHWFNPLIWLSFALMSRDMEMSCDESVLSRLGDSAKARYSGSLLLLSAKRNALLTANPLAFGESHVKARILNVLNYKKPTFWVIVIGVVVVCAATIFFGANPRDKQADELEKINVLAWEIINRDIANYESNPKVNIVDSKITRLELVDSFDALTNTPIDIYALEYRLLPEDLSKVVLAGGMDIDEEGWLKEKCSMGSPLLVVSRKADSVELIGTLWTGEVGSKEGLKSAVKELLKLNSENEVKKLVEENLAVIMSTPNTSSNPQDYINAHPNEYENIIKLGGDNALQYMLSQFETGNAEGLRGQIMMRLCKELLGTRNNVTDESMSPQEWYNALSIRQEIHLPDFRYDGNNAIEKLVYATEIERASHPKGGFIVVAPKIFGSYKEDDLLKVFVTTYSKSYKLFGNVLDDVGGSIIPSAITYKDDGNGNYVLFDYEQAKDGAYFGSSIREFCTMPVSGKEIPGLADEIFEHYGNYNDIRNLQYENLFKHLSANGIKEATLTNSRGEIEFSMTRPSYKPFNNL